jgi:glycosyltransferase involved in cell wall biosynthesis
MNRSDRLSVGLDLTQLIDTSGGQGRYARELIRAMLAVEPETRLTLFVSAEAPADLWREDWADGVGWVRVPLRVSGGPPGGFALLMAWRWLGIGAVAAARRLDVIHGVANVAPLVAPGVARVVTLLDLIWIHHPEALEPAANAGMRRIAPRSARAADRVIAISEAARADLIRTLRLPAARVDVTRLGIRPSNGSAATPEPDLRERLGIGPGPVVLCVAQKRLHKNLARLVAALAEVDQDRAQLALVGQATPHEQELRSLADELGLSGRVHFPGWLSEEELEGLYRASSCFVLPSLEEGFGLPVLEAMQRDVPVACSNVSSLPEVAGDAAVLFDPLDPGDIARAIGSILRDDALRSELVRRGGERCRLFTWEATARATLVSYRRALETGRRPV